MVGSGMLDGLVPALVGFGVLFTLIICGLIWAAVSFLSSDELKVYTPLKYDRIELIINKGKVDTLYVYELKKY